MFIYKLYDNFHIYRLKPPKKWEKWTDFDNFYYFSQNFHNFKCHLL
nr:MAG TPA: hypothetical protein [Caudoviricetes sp.]